MQWERPRQVFASSALTTGGWKKDVLITLADGRIESVQAGAAKPEGVAAYDLLLPGMANVHSHAFQRAMAGLTEVASPEKGDNFWKWREVMYRFKQALTPDHVQAIALYFYIELLKAGYTAIGEFHYIHHDAEGKPYADPAEMSERILAAAEGSGIHLTMLPVMYETANFGGEPFNDGQKRFVHKPEDFLKLVETLKGKCAGREDVNLGVAPHSLRAVRPETLSLIVESLPKMGLKGCPIHIHLSEQEKEVADCMAWCGQRPGEWLVEHAVVDEHWCLIHGTHLTPHEIKRLVAANATVGLCPTTEANLGDGIFNAPVYFAAGGRFGIGSDSHVCVSPWVEIRAMEYAQRLHLRERVVLADTQVPSVGRNLYTRAAAGGAAALGIGNGIVAGGRADLVAYETSHPLLAGRKDDQLLDSFAFALATAPVTDVYVAGRHVVQKGHHKLETESAAAMRAALQSLLG